MKQFILRVWDPSDIVILFSYAYVKISPALRDALDTSDLCWRYREISGEIRELGDELEPEEEK